MKLKFCLLLMACLVFAASCANRGSARVLLDSSAQLLQRTEERYTQGRAPYTFSMSETHLRFGRAEYNKGDYKTASKAATVAYVYAERTWHIAQIDDEQERKNLAARFEEEKNFKQVLADYAAERRAALKRIKGEKK